MDAENRWIHTTPRKSATFDDYSISEIRRAAATGIYDIRGFGAKRKLPDLDDLLFLGASISRYPLEGYREKCATDVRWFYLALPEVAIGSYPFFDPQHGPNTNVVLRARDAQKLAQAKSG